MDKRLIEWAVTKRGVVVENEAMWGKPAGDFAGERLDGVHDVRATEGGCGCGGCGCDQCQPSTGQPCPMCGKMLMSDAEGCDECAMMKGWGVDESEVTEVEACATCKKEPCKCDEAKSSCDECGGEMVEGICEGCGRSEMVESVMLEAKKKGPSKKTQKKIAKTLVKKAGKGKDKKVSMTKLAKMTKKWADEPYAAAQYMKQMAKK